MEQTSQGLRGLSCRWQAAIETTNDPELKRHFAGHVVYLTKLADRMESSETSAGEARSEPPERRDDRRTVVLVLEDDDICRDVARNTLRAAGFEVICASSFDEAVFSVEDGAKIDIALVDVNATGNAARHFLRADGTNAPAAAEGHFHVGVLKVGRPQAH
jgi:PleD family two-component response regulator